MSTAAPRETDPTAARHLPALDGVRGIAILMVLFYHAIVQGSVSALPDRIVSRIASFGWAGVDLFFVLSGLLITGILLDAKGKPGYFTNFYARRSLRIFPLYYLFLVIAIFIVPLLATDPATIDPRMRSTQWWHWSYCVNLLIALKGQGAPPEDTGHFWSLAVEEQFYLIWPTLVFLFGRVSFKRLVISTIIGAWLLRVLLVWFGAGYFFVYVMTPTRADALAAGALLAILAREPGGLARFKKWSVPMGAVASILIAVDFFLRHRIFGQKPDPFQLDGSFIALLGVSVILAAVNSVPGTRTSYFYTNPFFRFFGRYSYCLYVVHFPLIHFLQRSVLPRQSFPHIGDSVLPGTLLFTALVIGISVIIALLSWHFFENPILKLKRYFPSRGSRGPAPTLQGAPGTAA